MSVQINLKCVHQSSNAYTELYDTISLQMLTNTNYLQYANEAALKKGLWNLLLV